MPSYETCGRTTLWIKFKVRPVGLTELLAHHRRCLETSHFSARLKSSISAQPERHLELPTHSISSLFTVSSVEFRQRCTLRKLALNTNNCENIECDDGISSLCLIGYWGMCVIHTPHTSLNLKFRVFLGAPLWFWDSRRLEPDGAGWDKGTVASWGTVNTCLSFPGSRTSGLPLMPSLCTLSSSSCQPVSSGLHTEWVGSGQQWTFIAQLFDCERIAMHNFVI